MSGVESDCLTCWWFLVWESERLREELVQVPLLHLEHQGWSEVVEEERVDAGGAGAHLVFSLTQVSLGIKQVSVRTSEKYFVSLFHKNICWYKPEHSLSIQYSRSHLLTHVKVVAAGFFTEVSRFGAGIQWSCSYCVLRLLIDFITVFWSEAGRKNKWITIIISVVLSWFVAGRSQEVMIAVVDPGVVPGAWRTQILVDCAGAETLVEWCAGPGVSPHTWTWTLEPGADHWQWEDGDDERQWWCHDEWWSRTVLLWSVSPHERWWPCMTRV